MNKSRGIVVAAGFLLAAAGLALAAGGDAAPRKDTVWPAEAIKWDNGPLPGTKVAKLWGDWMKDAPYGVLIKFDAGIINSLHKHTHDLKIAVISGTFVHTPEGGAESRLGPGSYLLQVGGINHVSGCAPGADCEFLMTSNGKFDLIEAKTK